MWNHVAHCIMQQRMNSNKGWMYGTRCDLARSVPVAMEGYVWWRGLGKRAKGHAVTRPKHRHCRDSHCWRRVEELQERLRTMAMACVTESCQARGAEYITPAHECESIITTFTASTSNRLAPGSRVLTLRATNDTDTVSLRGAGTLATAEHPIPAVSIS